ncbi:MAG: araC [Burkholderia sp.]|nr:araC [Burkholderia sp.]
MVSGDGQRLVMAGGGASWLVLILYLIARSVGIDVAMQVARLNLIDWHTMGQQPFAQCQTWIAEHYSEPAPVQAMARVSGLPERSFKRRFEQATGMSSLEYVHTLRIEEAKQVLESGDLPIESIANGIGYEDAGCLSRCSAAKSILRRLSITSDSGRCARRCERRRLPTPLRLPTIVRQRGRAHHDAPYVLKRVRDLSRSRLCRSFVP